MSVRLLREWVRELLLIEGEALESETHLANSINQMIAGHGKADPKTGKKYLELRLGSLGRQKVLSAKKSGGGVPEPKADVVITTAGLGDVGVSMKAPNYDFIQSRMQMGVLRSTFGAAGVDDATIQEIITGLTATCNKLASNYADQFTQQKTRLISTATSIDPDYSFPDPVWPYMKPLGAESEMAKALVSSRGWRVHGNTVRSLTEIPTSETRSSLKDAVGQTAFNSFMTDIVAGGDDMPPENRANAMLQTLVTGVTTSISELQTYLDDITSVEEAVQYYSNAEVPPEMRLIYRSEAASRTSKTESRRYDAISDAVAITPSGTDTLKWTVSIVKGRKKKV